MTQSKTLDTGSDGMEDRATARKAEWIAALRGGNFRQGKYTLKTDGGYCCLGVACAVAKLSMSYLDVCQTYGIQTTVACDLAEMNDDGGKSFAEIADWLEAHDLRTGALLQAEGGSP